MEITKSVAEFLTSRPPLTDPAFTKWGVTLLGMLTLAQFTRKTIEFLTPYLLPSRLNKFKHTLQNQSNKEKPWAVVTGSTDGIGKGFALELAAQGFNLILIGRNPDKLANLEKELRAVAADCQTATYVSDASKIQEKTTQDFSHLVRLIGSKPVTVLVNNVGRSTAKLANLTELEDQDIVDVININDVYPTLLTKQLLPTLVSNSPSLILNVGSMAGDHGFPFMTVYSGTKAYNKAWSRGLSVEMKMLEHKIQVQHLLVGSVNSGSNKVSVSITSPTSRVFARSALKVTTTRKIVAPYFWHALQMRIFEALPEWVIDTMLIGMIGQIKANIGSKEE
ncbi:uncharacterized protein EV422DRAFT_61207 [Fimicolochytrium jonesii]|uniref:uncharacterized protein n=1 Tax=Fimicolochytrium jonesii TaxID=1396493 RepID=UPI0022FED8EB|nr:uncharacterized protein EV422DRAFT_61207 [Fimicolochytrium jonesii]KAI8820735.1 hypothetical protein EV422DRAFT_61207 [Fimicolochytrium jonesii]